MDLTHWILVGILLLAVAITGLSFWGLSRMLRKDEAIDAATFLAVRYLREWLERSKADGTLPRR